MVLLFLSCAAVVEIGFTQLEYSVDETDGQVLVCIELLTPVHLSSPIVLRVETEDQTAIGIYNATICLLAHERITNCTSVYINTHTQSWTGL